MGIILFGRPGLLDLKLSGTENLKLHRAAKAMWQNQMPLYRDSNQSMKLHDPLHNVAKRQMQYLALNYPINRAKSFKAF